MRDTNGNGENGSVIVNLAHALNPSLPQDKTNPLAPGSQLSRQLSRLS
ncbi:hypothetical protein O59_003637 [Cellvibrio sp. BR]|nr:hypothetical protein O59_003637 [Cellvibrio sp. BR]